MYSVTVKTNDSEAEYGTSISSTSKLHEFLCSVDFKNVIDLHIHYYREVKNPHELSEKTNTGAMSVVKKLDEEERDDIVSLISAGPDSWDVAIPKKDKPKSRNGLSIVTNSLIR